MKADRKGRKTALQFWNTDREKKRRKMSHVWGGETDGGPVSDAADGVKQLPVVIDLVKCTTKRSFNSNQI